ncbi:MAG: DUF6778 family protein [Pseudomonadota bacterium]
MRKFKSLALMLAALGLSACAGSWATDYDGAVGIDVSRNWSVQDVQVTVPDALTVSNDNTFAPDADIVWHGDPFGDRRSQVSEIMDNGITAGTRKLRGSQPVVIRAQLITFHAVTPKAVSEAPAAVHNISYLAVVADARTGAFLTEPEIIQADLEAFTGSAAVIAAQQGQTQKVRINEHLARVTEGWLGVGPDMRRSFGGLGR